MSSFAQKERVGHSRDLGVVDGDERAQHLVERDGGRRVPHGLARQRLEEHAVRELPHLPDVHNAVFFRTHFVLG
jgi:hypothetical protein